MIKPRHLKPWTPEIILLAETLFYWIASSPLNYIAMGLVMILVLQKVYKNSTAESYISLLFLLLNLYMCLALASELNEATVWSTKATNLLFLGGIILSVGIFSSLAMLAKWMKRLPAARHPVQ